MHFDNRTKYSYEYRIMEKWGLILRIRYIRIGLISLLILLLGTINHAIYTDNLSDRPGKNLDFLPYATSKDRIIYSTPSASSSVTLLPWENNPDFQAAMAENKAKIQLANYCTVLQNPLPGEETNVYIAACLLKGTVVKSGQIFSQNEKIGPYSQDKGFQPGPVYIGHQLKTTVGGGVCKIASTLYNVTILSNLPVIERYAHSMPVPYVPLGQDATVCYGVKDFKFLNNSPYPILIWAESIGNRLYIAFYGQTTPPKVKWHHEIVKEIKTYNIYRKNYALEAGKEKVILQGMDGAVVRSWLTIEDLQQGRITTKKLGKDYYNPMPSIVEKGMKKATSTIPPH